MSETKFTKGEWVVKGSSMSMGSNYRGSFSIESNSFDGDISTANAANKALIKAAPDMYDMLATIENDIGQVPAWLWDKIQLTLAKARGEA
ncbi:hypothetical protein MAELSTROM_17 [Pseudoalteromonas phage Maelstrom]|uniref:hypothetical protein n=1 Tax=Pseudoalteromonas phage Maelstrom TaxID=2065202 RepID=UPI000CA337D1|nr:hypothetical protein PP584_gp17 [Pseudoalteromonas phage Maelstrom]AUG84937.1 hypothetical protein MAELSTROM_17 [Pseudoalteromonas phage Maelstrom]